MEDEDDLIKGLTKEDLQDEIICILFNYLIKENNEYRHTLKNLIKERRKYCE